MWQDHFCVEKELLMIIIRDEYLNEIIKNNQRFFDYFSETDSITIVGWSVGRVDIPYLRKVAESVKAETIWHVYWHDEKAEKMLEDAFDQVGITLKYRDFNPDTKFWDRL